MKEFKNIYLLVILICILMPTEIVLGQAGMLDPDFGTAGLVSTTVAPYDDWGTAIAIQGDGKIILAGQSGNGFDVDFSMARYTVDGLLDETFGTGGIVLTPIGIEDDKCWAINVLNDGKILLAGAAYNGINNDFAMVRYLPNGTIDPTFGTDGIVLFDFYGDDDYGYAITTQADNKIVMVGTATVDYPQREYAVARFNNDGTIDNTFGIDGKVTTDMWMFTAEKATSVIVLSDNKIVVGGNCNGSIGIARYNSDGTLDNSFSADGHLLTDLGIDPTYPISIAVQTDGKIVAAGHEREDAPYLDKMNFGLVRYNVDGSIDETFDDDGIVITNFDVTTGDVGFSIDIQTDGKIIVAGQSYTVCFGIGYFALARYNTNGTLDTTFGTGGLVNTDFGFAHDAAFAVAIQADGKIVAGGQTGIDSIGRRFFGLARYLNDCFYNTNRTVTQEANILTSNADDMNYQWVDCNYDYAAILDANNQTFTATQNGTYAVIINNGICADTSDCLVVNNLAVDTEINLNQVTVSPNPFDNNLNITMQTESGLNQLWQLELYNSIGENVFAYQIVNGKIEVNTGNLLSGIYILKCHHAAYNKSFILIKN